MHESNHDQDGKFSKGNQLATQKNKLYGNSKLAREKSRIEMVFMGEQMLTLSAEETIDQWSKPDATMAQKLAVVKYLEGDTTFFWRVMEYTLGKPKQTEVEDNGAQRQYIITELVKAIENDPFRGEISGS